MDLHQQACRDWISFTLVTNLAFSASGIVIESARILSEDLYFLGLCFLHPLPLHLVSILL